MHESSDHAALVELFRGAPQVAATLLTRAFGVVVPAGPGRVVDPVQRPAALIPDLVLEFGEPGRGRLAIIVEVQRNIDARKRLTWPAYLWLERLRRGCDVCLLVFAPDAKVAAWAAEPIECGAGNRTCPQVVGPAQVPWITDPAQIEAAPGLAALSARVHGQDHEGPAIVRAVLWGLRGLDEEIVRVYLDVTVAGLQGNTLTRVRQQLTEDGMQNEFRDIPKARVPTPSADAFIESMYPSAVELGVGHGLRRALFKILQARGLVVTPEQRQQIKDCIESDVVDEWIGRATAVRSVEELLAGPATREGEG